MVTERRTLGYLLICFGWSLILVDVMVWIGASIDWGFPRTVDTLLLGRGAKFTIGAPVLAVLLILWGIERRNPPLI